MIGLLGSTVFVLTRLTPGLIGGWYDPLRLESTFGEYISTEISAAKSVVLFLSAITIPIAGLVYYGVSTAKALKRRSL